MIKHKDAFAPFSIGPFGKSAGCSQPSTQPRDRQYLTNLSGCIGKNLALMEIRLLTTQLVMLFDVSFAPGEDGQRLLEKTTDHFTLGLGDLDLVFRKR